MAKYLSDVAQFWFGGYDLGADTTQAEMGNLCRALPTHGWGDSAEKNIAGILAGEFRHDGMLEDAANQFNAAAAALINTTPAVTLAVSNTAGKRAFSGLVYQSAFKTPMSLGGLILGRVDGTTDGKVESSALVIQEKVTKTSNFNSASVNNSASSSNGGVGFIHVFAADGTADVVIEESSDDGAGDAFATVLTFAQFSGISSERVAITGTVEQYLRVALTLGTATSVTYAVTFARL